MKRNGFSLVELIIVIGILGFLLALVISEYHSYYLKQLALTTAENIRSDLDFSVQHALTRGASNSIQFSTSPGLLQVVDPYGMVKSTTIPASVQVAVSGFDSGSPAQGATADIVPGNYWLGFLPQGKPVTGGPALIVVATETAWYAIAVNGDTGEVSGPTNNRTQLALSDSDLSTLLGGGEEEEEEEKPEMPNQQQPVDTIPQNLANKIKHNWAIP